MSTREKAEMILHKLYLLWRTSFTFTTVDDILLSASDDEISFYYFWLCERGNK